MTGPLFAFPFLKNQYRVIDGDTVAVTLDRGWADTKETSLRLIGLNAPEVRIRHDLHKETGNKVTALVTKWFADRSTKFFYASSDDRPKYFGRTLGRIWANDLSDCLNDYLLQLKVVKVYLDGPKPGFSDDELREIITICDGELVKIS